MRELLYREGRDDHLMQSEAYDMANDEAPNGVVASVRRLSQSDLPALLALCLGNPQYYAFLGEEPTLDALAAEMVELPPGCLPDQKFYLGFFSVDGVLVAVLDLVRGYPADGCVFIGFFMVDFSRQGGGVGSSLILRILNRLRDEGVVCVRLAYVEGNEQSRRFWEKCGFVEVGTPVDQGEYRVVPMERRLV